LSVTADVKFSEPEASPAREGLDLFEFFGLLWRAKYFIIATVLLFAVGGVYKALNSGDTYTAKMVVASVGQTNSSALGQLGALVGIQQVTEDREFAQFQALMKSTVLAERLESRYGVMKIFFEGLWDPSASGGSSRRDGGMSSAPSSTASAAGRAGRRPPSTTWPRLSTSR
jgi:hypothetical protein